MSSTPRVKLRPLPLSRLSLCLASLAIPTLVTTSHGASLYWDGTSTGPDADGGAGTWSTDPPANWDTSASGGADSPWLLGSDAVFGGTGATVFISGGITSPSLTFTSPGYQFTGGGIQAVGALAINTAGNDVIINSALTGSGTITKTGTGMLTLGGVNAFSGLLTISAGTVKANGNFTLGSGGTTNSGTVVSAGATLDVNGKSLGTERITISGSGVGGAGVLVNTGAAINGGTQFITLAGPATVGGTARWDLRNNSGTATLQMGGHALAKTGPGAVYLVNASVGTPGSIEVKQGSFWLESNTSLGGSASNVITVRNGATLAHSQYDREPLWTAAFDAGGTWHSGYLASSWKGPVTLAGATTFEGGAHIGGETTTMRVLGVISGPGSVTKIGPGSWTLSAQNTFAGGTTVEEGTLILNAANANTGIGTLRGVVAVEGGTLRLPVSGVLGTAAGSRVSELTINGGLVDITSSTNHGVPLLNMGAGTLRSNGGNTSSQATAYYLLANDGVVHGLPAEEPGTIGGRLHLGTGNTGNTSVFDIEAGPATAGLRVTAAITEEAAGSGITKRGNGLLVLGGPALFTGTTKVEAGMLRLGNEGSLTESPVLVNAGGAFAADVAGKSLASLTAEAGSTLQLPALAGGTTTVEGNLTLAAGTIGISPVLGADTVAGTYDLITAGSITGAGVPVLDLAGAYGPTRATGTVAVNGNKLQLTLIGTGADLLWNNASAAGSSVGSWDGLLENFHDGVSNSVFQAFDSVTFDDTVSPGATKYITLTSILAPARMTVDNSLGDYFFITGPGALAGAGSLVKTGSSNLIFAGSNDYTMTGPITAAGGAIDFSNKTISATSLTLAGGAFHNATASFGSMDLQSGLSNATLQGGGAWAKTTSGSVSLLGNNKLTGPGTVAAGSLIVGSAVTPDVTGSLGTGPVAIASGASLGFSRSSSSVIVSNDFSGNGTLNFLGSNDGSNGHSSFDLAGDSSDFSGPVNVSNSQLRLLSGATVGSGPITLTGYSLLVASNVILPNAISIATADRWGDGSFHGTLELGDATLTGPLTLPGSSTTIIRNTPASATKCILSGPIGESGGSASLSISGSTGNVFTLSGASTYTGTTTLSGPATYNLTGSLGPSAVTVGGFAALGGNGVIGGGGSLTFQNASALKADTSASALTVNGNVDLGPSAKLRVEVLPTLASGPFPVLQYTGTLTGTAANLAMESPALYRNAVFAFTPGLITLDIGSKALIWKAESGGTWTYGTNTAANWGTTPSPAKTDFFYQGDSVVFDDTGGGGYVSGPGGSFTAQPSSMVVNNSTKDYSIGTSISGPCAVTKNGTGSLRMSGSQSAYTGGTVVNAGRLEAHSGGGSPPWSVLGTGPVSIAAGATLAGEARLPGAVTIHGTVSPNYSGDYSLGFLITGPTVLTGTYVCELDDTGCDLLQVEGDLDLTGSTLALEKTFSGTYGPAEFVIATYTGNLTGSFGTVSGLPANHVLKYDSAAKRIVVASMSLANWVAGFPGLADSSAAGDPDGDGIPNLLEYVFGSNPGTGDPAILPQPSVDEFYFFFRYLRSDSSYHHTVQTVQWSTDLDTWTDIPVGDSNNGTVMIAPNGDAPDEITVRVPRTEEPIFARLRVVEK